MDFSLMFFGHRGSLVELDPYALYVEAARFADENNFSAVWFPERHFTELGCIFANPAILHAAIARETKRIRLCTGSIVLPLHHPAVVAENWAMVDRLSAGRVGLSVASGWHADDFVLRPENYPSRHKILFDSVEVIKKLWGGEELRAVNGLGQDASIRLPLSPLQKDIPIWITSAGNDETLRSAGAGGFNLLTHTFNDDLDTLASKIATYRSAYQQAGHLENGGRVTVMVHTFLGRDRDEVRDLLRNPYRAYLRSNRSLMAATGQIDLAKVENLSDVELDSIADFVFERLYNGRALLGTPESCEAYARQMQDMGVDEVACLLDFGIDSQTILRHLPFLDALRKRLGEDSSANAAAPSVRTRAVVPVTSESLSSPETAPTFSRSLTGSEYYRKLDAMQEAGGSLVFYGQAFRCIKSIRWNDTTAMGELELGTALASDSDTYRLHPVLWDNAFQILGVLALQDDAVAIHTGYEKLQVFGRPQGRISVQAELVERDPARGELVGNLRISSSSGTLLASVEGLRFKYVSKAGKPALEPSAPTTLAETSSAEIADIILEQLARTLGYPVETLDTETQILDLGVDSLIALELKNELDRKLRISLPVVSLLANPTIAALIALVGKLVGDNQDGSVQGATEELTL